MAVIKIRAGTLILLNFKWLGAPYTLQGYYPSYDALCYHESKMKDGDKGLAQLSHWSLYKKPSHSLKHKPNL